MTLFESSLSKYLMTMLISAIPVIELRGAIPAGIAAGLSPMAAFSCAVIGNLLPTPFLILLTRRVFAWLRQHKFWQTKLDWLQQRAHAKSQLVRKYRLLGLILLVAIPLPGTGAWTGSLVAVFMDLPLRHALPAILLGVLIAGAVTLGVTCGVIHLL